MKKIRVGLVGTGFAADIHMRAYRRVYGVDVSIDAVCSRGEGAPIFAERHCVPTVKRDYRELIASLQDGDNRFVFTMTPIMNLPKKLLNEDFAIINLVKIVPFESWNYRILSQ